MQQQQQQPQTYGRADEQINPGDMPKQVRRNVKMPTNPIARFFWRFGLWDWLLIALGFAFFVLALVFFGLWYNETGTTTKLQAVLSLPRSTCPNDLNCLKTSNRILQSSDSNEDPCDNFYNFACKGFVRRNFYPNLVTGKTRFVDKLEEVKNNAVMRILSGDRNADLEAGLLKQDPSLKPVLQAVNNYYNACLSVTGPAAKVNYLQSTSEQDIIKNQLAINKTVKTVADFLQAELLPEEQDQDSVLPKAFALLWKLSPNTLGQIRGFDTTGNGIFPTGFFDVVVYGDYRPNFRPSLVVVPPNLPVPKEVFNNLTAGNAYKNIIRQIVITYIYPTETQDSTIDGYVDKIFEIESRISSMLTARPSAVDPSWNASSLNQLDSQFEKAMSVGNGFSQFFVEIGLPSLYTVTDSDKVSTDLPIYVTPTSYFTDMNDYLSSVSNVDILRYSAYIACYQLGIVSQLHNLPLPLISFSIDASFNPYVRDASSEYGLFGRENKKTNRLRKFDTASQLVPGPPAYLSNFVKDSRPYNNDFDVLANTQPPSMVSFATDVGYDSSAFLSSSFVTPNKEGLVLESVTGSVCMQDTVEKYSLAVGVFYEALYMNVRDFAELQTITTNVQDAFVKRIQENQYLDDAAKDFASKKILNLRTVIGIADQVTQPGYISEFYKLSQTADSQDFFTNALLAVENMNTVQMRLYTYDLALMTLSLFQDFTAVDAYYTPIFNMVVIPFGMMQDEILSFANPRSMNYGVFGFIVGHELSHAIDPLSNSYDEYGKLVSSTMSTETVTKISEGYQYFEKYYERFLIDGIGVGAWTASQVIADNGGLHAAWDAYKTVSAQDNNNVILPAIAALSQDSLFFLNFGQLFCQSVDSTVEDFDHTNPDNEYPVARFRVNGAVSLMTQFASTYNCESSDKMAPSDSVAVGANLW